mmetsp:Transcript_24579/g.74936  ORF Transcript_24579/g.74936 Transcript_24579/m.74936 type:complete len:97 (+) Transcript_24579:396-686(+)|eukprot:scaffold83691_cov45-Tisochrysis_lutea.AAC.2
MLHGVEDLTTKISHASHSAGNRRQSTRGALAPHYALRLGARERRTAESGRSSPEEDERLFQCKMFHVEKPPARLLFIWNSCLAFDRFKSTVNEGCL